MKESEGRPRRVRRVLCVAVAWCWIACSAVLAQRVWIVDGFQRPGFDYATIQPAVDAAASGDVIRLRATSTNLVDWYAAPTINGKDLTITSEAGGRATVSGTWNIQGVPNRLTLAAIELFCNNGYQMLCTTSAGAISFESTTGVRMSPSIFTDCSLVTFRQCNLTTSGALFQSFKFTRCSVSITDSAIVNQPLGGSWGAAALVLHSCNVKITGSTIEGASGAPPWPAIEFCSTDLLIGAGSHINGGRYYDGSPYSAVQHTCVGAPILVTSHLSIDWGAITSIGLWPPTRSEVAYIAGVQTGLSVTQTATTLQASQHTHPLSLTVLAIGALTTTPWTNVVGPVFVDPTSIVGYFDPAGAGAVTQRTFAIPPGLPLNTNVALQAFELMPDGRITTSNVCVAGIW